MEKSHACPFRKYLRNSHDCRCGFRDVAHQGGGLSARLLSMWPCLLSQPLMRTEDGGSHA